MFGVSERDRSTPSCRYIINIPIHGFIMALNPIISRHQYLIIGIINGILSSIFDFFHQYLLYPIINIPFSKYLPYTIPINSNIIWYPIINISSMAYYLPYLINFHQYLLYPIINIPFSKYLPYTIPINSNIIWYPIINISSMVISMVYFLP